MINQITDISEINQEKIINQIRSLGIDMIYEAQSGHPGIVLGAAPIIYTLYAHHWYRYPYVYACAWHTSGHQRQRRCHAPQLVSRHK